MRPRWWRGRAGTPGQAPDQAGPPEPATYDAMLAETVATHFPAARIDGTVVHLGFGDLSLDCRVGEAVPFGSLTAVTLTFSGRGGPLGPAPVFMSMSGYGETPEHAVVGGGCEWTCGLGAVLRTALGGMHDDDVEEFVAAVDGRRHRVTSAGLDRAFGGPEDGTGAGPSRLRDRLAPGQSLTAAVLAADVLPVLPATSATVLSVLVGEVAGRRTVEVKVNGADWPPATRAFTAPVDDAQGSVTLLRELAVLVPEGAARVPARAAMDRTLAGLALRDEPWQPAGWRGWRAHDGLLTVPMTAAELDAVEATTGRLDDDHRTFLTTVAAAGAGPGYGLLRPAVAGEVLPLAHGGCGVTWVLRLDAAHRGEVWIDAQACDGTFAPVASSFLGWYLGWLEAAVRDTGPWKQWDSRHCATASVLSQLLYARDEEGAPGPLSDAVRPGSITLTSGGGYVPAGAVLDPCHGCTTLASNLGLSDDVFARGVLTAVRP